MHHPRHRVLSKSLEILRYLVDHRFGATIEELAKEFDMSRREAYRYKAAFEKAGIDLTAHFNPETRSNRWRLKDRPRYAQLLGVAR